MENYWATGPHWTVANKSLLVACLWVLQIMHFKSQSNSLNEQIQKHLPTTQRKKNNNAKCIFNPNIQVTEELLYQALPNCHSVQMERMRKSASVQDLWLPLCKLGWFLLSPLLIRLVYQIHSTSWQISNFGCTFKLFYQYGRNTELSTTS